MGTYLYLERSGRIGEAQEWAGKVRTDAEVSLQTARSRITSAWHSVQLDKWLPNRRGSTSDSEKPEIANDIKSDSPFEGVMLPLGGGQCRGDCPEQRHSLHHSYPHTSPHSRHVFPSQSRHSISTLQQHKASRAGSQAEPTASQSPAVQPEGQPDAEEATTVTEKDVKRIDNLMQEAILGRTMPDPTDTEPGAPEGLPDKAPAQGEQPAEAPGPLQLLQEITSQIDQAAKATMTAPLTTLHRPEVGSSSPRFLTALPPMAPHLCVHASVHSPGYTRLPGSVSPIRRQPAGKKRALLHPSPSINMMRRLILAQTEYSSLRSNSKAAARVRTKPEPVTRRASAAKPCTLQLASSPPGYPQIIQMGLIHSTAQRIVVRRYPSASPSRPLQPPPSRPPTHSPAPTHERHSVHACPLDAIHPHTSPPPRDARTLSSIRYTGVMVMLAARCWLCWCRSRSAPATRSSKAACRRSCRTGCCTPPGRSACPPTCPPQRCSPTPGATASAPTAKRAAPRPSRPSPTSRHCTPSSTRRAPPPRFPRSFADPTAPQRGGMSSAHSRRTYSRASWPQGGQPGKLPSPRHPKRAQV